MTGDAAVRDGARPAVFGDPPRLPLAVLPTPLRPAPRLAAELGLPGPLLIKRDDLTGFAYGGNKARQLELLVGAAFADHADVLVTGGAIGSNFVASAAAAARFAGLEAVLVLAGEPRPASAHPNLAAALAWGATPRWTGDPDRASVDALLEVVAAELTAGGARPVLLPRGGANSLGALAFRLAFDEMEAQLADRLVAGGPAPVVVVASGSGGTLAGLLAGAVATGRRANVVGVSVSRPLPEVSATVLTLARDVAAGRGEPPAEPADLRLVDGRGPGHGLPSPAGRAAAQAALRAEGVVLDPVYTAKALAAVPTLPEVAGGAPIVFWHTGGVLDAVAAMMREPT